MGIPYQYNRMGAGGIITEAPKVGVRGVFCSNYNGTAIMSGMSVNSLYLQYDYASSKVKRVDVYSGGVAKNCTVGSYCSIVASNGGKVVSPTINSYANVQISSGAVLSGATVNYYGYAYISSGASASDIRVNSYGYLVLNSGSAANVTGVISAYIQGRDGVLENMVCSSGMQIYISGSNAAIRNVTCYGYLSVHSNLNRNLTSVTFASSGCLCMSSGVVLNDIIVSSGGCVRAEVYGNDENTVLRGTNSLGSTFYISNGTAFNVPFGGGSNYIHEYGSVVSCVLGSNAYLFLSLGAVAKDIMVSRGGYIFVASGGSAADIILESSGYMSLSYGGSASNVEIRSNATCYCREESACVENVNVKSGACIYVSNYGIVSSANISSGGYGYFYNYASGNNVIISSGAYCCFYALTRVSNVIVSSCGYASGSNFEITSMTVSSGGSAYMYSGYIENFSAEYATNMHFPYCKMEIAHLGSSAFLYMSSNAEIVSVFISSGAIVSGYYRMSARNIDVENGGIFSMASYGRATSVTLSSGASLYIGSYCTCLAVTSNEGAIVTNNGGYIEYV